MGKRTLTKEEIWQLVFGAAAIATGGGGACPTYERFSERADAFFKEGHEPILIDPTDVKDDDVVFCNIGCGGGIRYEYAKQYSRYHPPNGWLKQIDLTRTLNSWSKLPSSDRGEEHLKKLAELVGKEPVAYIPFEVGPLDVGQIYACARRGLPLIDDDLAGYRAVPELALTKMNAFNAPVTPYTVATRWGDLIVGHNCLSHQRFADICRHIAVTSGGGCSPAYSISGKYIKMGKTHNTLSLTIKIGKAMLEAIDSGDEPVEALLKASQGYKIFEGKVAHFLSDRHTGFIWGTIWIEGTGKYEGKTFKLWFKNENQISWIDEEPYVTCPDPFTVIDPKTGMGLSNFRSDWWTPGKEVVVTAMKAADHWRSGHGLRIYRPKHFGYDIKWVPVEEKLAQTA